MIFIKKKLFLKCFSTFFFNACLVICLFFFLFLLPLCMLPTLFYCYERIDFSIPLHFAYITRSRVSYLLCNIPLGISILQNTDVFSIFSIEKNKSFLVIFLFFFFFALTRIFMFGNEIELFLNSFFF